MPGNWAAVVQFAGDGQDFNSPTFGGLALMVVGSLAVLLPLFAVASLPPLTVTLLVTDAAALAKTLTVRVKILVPLVAIAVELVQVITCGVAAFELHVQLTPFVPPVATVPTAPLLTESPVGKVSVTVIVPEVAAVPLLETVNV